MAFWIEEHDFNKYPELSNNDLNHLSLVSPHPQIEGDFRAVVVKVIDGDTVNLKCDFRDFVFPLRLLKVDAPELSTGAPGEEAKNFLKNMVENEEVMIKIDRNNRVGKYGRLLGDIVFAGTSMADLLLQFGFAVPFGRRHEGKMIDLNKLLRFNQWF